ncbi:ATP-dependent DNA ligase [Streptomyces altiplanensis]
MTPVRSGLVVEIAADVTRDAAGRWRHLVRLHRIRPDAPPDDIAAFGD